MAVNNFIPTIWSARILTALARNAVATAITNRDYEGEVRRAGDSVKITNFADPTIGDYTPHTDITIEAVDDATQSLLIDQSKYFAFEVDDVEKAQSVDDGKVMNVATERGSYSLKNVLDQFVLTTMVAGTAVANQIAEATISTPSDAYDAMVAWGVKLDESDVPEEGRWATITPAFHGLLQKDSRFIATGDAAAAEARHNGRVGHAAGFVIHKSNNLPDGAGAGAGKAMLAGSTIATTVAEQIVSVEANRMEKRFADYVKGLHVYGAKVTRPTALVTADIIVG